MFFIHFFFHTEYQSIYIKFAKIYLYIWVLVNYLRLQISSNKWNPNNCIAWRPFKSIEEIYKNLINETKVTRFTLVIANRLNLTMQLPYWGIWNGKQWRKPAMKRLRLSSDAGDNLSKRHSIPRENGKVFKYLEMSKRFAIDIEAQP